MTGDGHAIASDGDLVASTARAVGREQSLLRAQVDELQERLADVSRCLEDAELRAAELVAVHARAEMLEDELNAARSRADSLEEELTAMRHMEQSFARLAASRSWRYTKPLRAAKRGVLRLFRR
jgi:predicted RNase H-like nuclease (RuvC/YqgF family)